MRLLFVALLGLSLGAEQLFFIGESISQAPITLSRTDATLSSSVKGHLECFEPTCGYSLGFSIGPNPSGPTLLGYDVFISQSITGYLWLSEFESFVYRSDEGYTIMGAPPGGDGTLFGTNSNEASFSVRFLKDIPRLNRGLQVHTSGANGSSFDYEASLTLVAIPDPAYVPEPAPMGLCSLALIGGLGYRKWKARRALRPSAGL